ncbi:multiprotein-bridging factor 1 family protein [Amycolatopsis sp. NPDC098790]|uniref:helix-turn-helix domain-containing protein n=1 Tax=Amycolatopsis sp. NPDC098790 TaxID=3363939 RepID=UPI00382A7931
MAVTELSGDNVGDRLKAARKLAGMTQQQLSQSTHFSVSLIKKVEQGSVPPSAAFVANAAKALGLRTATLYGLEKVIDEPSPEAAGVADLRRALDAYDDPQPEGEPLDLATITARLAAASDKVLGLNHVAVAQQLPALLHHLYVLADQPGHEGELARGALHDAYRMAATVSGRFRQADLAAIASERHVQIADRTGDPLRIAISAYHRSTRYLQHGEYRAGLRLLDRARQHVATSAVDRAVAVQLDLRSSILAARAGDGAEADGYLDEARAIAKEFQPPAVPYYGVDASETNITVHWCAAPVEHYDGAEAVRRASSVRVTDPRRPERVGHHHIDMARAWMLHGDRGQALEELNAARRVAPNATRYHPSVRETVLALAAADRQTTDSLAGFARWSGVQL